MLSKEIVLNRVRLIEVVDELVEARRQYALATRNGIAGLGESLERFARADQAWKDLLANAPMPALSVAEAGA